MKLNTDLVRPPVSLERLTAKPVKSTRTLLNYSSTPLLLYSTSYSSSLIAMFLNCTRLGGLFHSPWSF
jgi:hypothetical protein